MGSPWHPSKQFRYLSRKYCPFLFCFEFFLTVVQCFPMLGQISWHKNTILPLGRHRCLLGEASSLILDKHYSQETYLTLYGKYALLYRSGFSWPDWSVGYWHIAVPVGILQLLQGDSHWGLTWRLYLVMGESSDDKTLKRQCKHMSLKIIRRKGVIKGGAKVGGN